MWRSGSSTGMDPRITRAIERRDHEAIVSTYRFAALHVPGGVRHNGGRRRRDCRAFGAGPGKGGRGAGATAGCSEGTRGAEGGEGHGPPGGPFRDRMPRQREDERLLRETI